MKAENVPFFPASKFLSSLEESSCIFRRAALGVRGKKHIEVSFFFYRVGRQIVLVKRKHFKINLVFSPLRKDD